MALACVRRVKALAESVGATVDEEFAREGEGLLVDAPAGYVWDATGGAGLNATAGDGRGQAWWAAACRDVERDMAAGIRKATPEEAAELSDYFDRPWVAPADAPERLMPTL